MPKELPPETAQRVLDYLLAVEESLHPSQSITIFRRITVADFEALHACKPDKVTDCKFISDELAAVVDGRGTYEKHERAGWVKRQPEIKLEACDHPGWGFHPDSGSYYHESDKASLWWQDDERTGWNYRYARKDGTGGTGFVSESVYDTGEETVAKAVKRAEAGMAEVSEASFGDSLGDLFDEPKPVAEPEERGPWVKLAKVGERPAGVEFGVGEVVGCMDCKGDAWAGCTDNADALWCCATHYRRKRIRCVFEAFAMKPASPFGAVFWKDGDINVNSMGAGWAPGHYALRGTLWTPATAPEVTAAKAGRDPNGVVAWHGGECPEGSGIVHYQDGETRGGLRFSVRLSDWTRDDDPSDIIAYEVTG
jgi:hypothetical protein